MRKENYPIILFSTLLLVGLLIGCTPMGTAAHKHNINYPPYM